MSIFKDTTIPYTFENNIDPDGMSRRVGKTDTIDFSSRKVGAAYLRAMEEKLFKQSELPCIENEPMLKYPELPRVEKAEWQAAAWDNYMRMPLVERVYLEALKSRTAQEKFDRAVANTPPGKCMVHDQLDRKVEFELACKFCREKQKTDPEWLCYWLDEALCAKLFLSARQITCTCPGAPKVTGIFHSGELNIMGRLSEMEKTWAPRVDDIDDDDDRTPSPHEYVLEEVD